MKATKKYNLHSTVIRQRKIRQRIDAERFEMEDFWRVCPYTMDELKKKIRKPEILAWRYTGYVWKMMQLKYVSYVGDFFDRDHSCVLHGLKQVDLALDGFGNKRISEAINLVCAESKKGNPILRSVPLSAYIDFLRKFLPELENVEEKARQSFEFLPTVLIGHAPKN